MRPKMNVDTDFLIEILKNEGHDASELCAILGIEPEDVYDRFRDKIWQRRREIYYANPTGEDDDEDDEDFERADAILED